MIDLSHLSRFRKQTLAALVDAVLLPMMFCWAIWLRYDVVSIALLAKYQILIIASPLISVPIFIRLGLYRAVIRFIDHKIVYVVLLGGTLSIAGLVAVASLTNVPELSRGVFVIYWGSAILYVLASRFFARGLLLRSASIAEPNAVKVAIYGAGKAGSQLATALLAGGEYIPVAFVDDKKELQNASIAGIRVHSPSDLARLIEKKDIKEILLAMPSSTRAQQKRILDMLEPFKVKTKVTPPLASLISGALGGQNLREIEFEDLLGRDTVPPNMQLIAMCISDKSVMVTGAGGSIGSELCRQILKMRPKRLILFELSEYALYVIKHELKEQSDTLGITTELIPILGSVLEQEKCCRILQTFEVDTLYHAAAYKHVPLVEHNPIVGIQNNAFGTRSIAQAAIQAKVKCFVLISTDKAVRPTNVMGASKRLAELILQSFARQQKYTRFCMVRFGNVLGSSGSVVPLFRKQIADGGPITVTHPEMTRYFMTIPEAAQLVLQAGAMGEGGDVFLLDMGEPVKILDLAKRMVHLSGREVKDENSEYGIGIVHVGLRPGEKLYEELLIGDNVEGTEHPLIMRAQESELPINVLNEILQKLEFACDNFNHEEVRSLLLRSVVEYAPQGEIDDFIWRENNRILLDAHPAKVLH